MNDITQPAYTPTAAQIAEPETQPGYYTARGAGEAEASMRVDFARVYRLREEAGKVGSLNEYGARVDQADALADRWRGGGDQELAQEWFGAEVGVDAWGRYPSEMHRRHAEVPAGYLDTMGGRSFLHARELTGNGRWPEHSTESDTAESDVEERDQLTSAACGGAVLARPSSALAEFGSSNALARNMENSEREGFER